MTFIYLTVEKVGKLMLFTYLLPLALFHSFCESTCRVPQWMRFSVHV